MGGLAVALGTLAVAYRSTHPKRRPVRRLPDEPLDLEDVRFPSRDGTTLAGWFVPKEGARAGIVLCHGFPGNRLEVLESARLLHSAGFDLLLFDFRALGESEGDLCSIGHHEVSDLLGAVDYLTARPEMAAKPVGVFGFSMGGAVALMAAAQDERIAAVATHGAYATLERAIRQRFRPAFGPLAGSLARATTFWGNRWLPVHPNTVSPADVIHRIAPRPVLLFHGERDLIVSPRDAQILFFAAREPKKLRMLRRSWHVTTHADERDAYERELVAFFQNHLNREER